MSAKPLTKHLLTCFACTEDFFVLVKAESEAIPNHCPFCGSQEIGDFGTSKPASDESEEIDG